MELRSWGTAVPLVLVLLAGCGSAADTSTTSPAVNPSTSAASTDQLQGGASSSALDALGTLAVKGRAPKTGYSRAQFGQAWTDVDRNGCDTRTDILGATLTGISRSGRCTIVSGTLNDPYTGTSIHYQRGGASEVDIDHVVALSNAWQTGAFAFPFAKRVALANDPLNLVAVDASTNRQKGDGDAAFQRPSRRVNSGSIPSHGIGPLRELPSKP